jgi:hypothetical protein
MIQFTLQVTKEEVTVITHDGGIATINLEDPTHIYTTYYQNRIERLAQPSPHPIVITDEEWEELGEGKAYIKDWDDISTVLTMEMIQDAVDWLVFGSGSNFSDPLKVTHRVPKNKSMNTPKDTDGTLLKSADVMRNYDPEAPENAEREKIRSAQMRALSPEEIEALQRKNAHLMVNAYSPANTTNNPTTMPEALDIGPAEAEDGLLTLTDEQFINRYKPETDEHGNYYRQRDWTDLEDQEAIEKATAENRIWTAGDDDNGNFCISSGWHFVNRLYYIITEIPLENPDWNVQIPSDEEEISDHVRELMDQTDTEADEWESMDGPQTGVGTEYWYRHIYDGREAYVVDDQGAITIEVSDPKES